jgi:preprotein translocase subunit SecE
MGATGEAALPGGPPAPPRRQTARASGQPQPDRDRQLPVTTDRRIPGTRFIGESWAELKKVEWPTQSQIIQATVVVLIACTIVGVYLWGADLVLRRLVEQVFLK